MNHPGNMVSDAELDEAVVLNNIMNVVSDKLDITPDFVSNIRNIGAFNKALSFIKANSGLPVDVL